MPPMPRKKGPPSFLRIDMPPQTPPIALALGDSSASALSSATSESDLTSPFPANPQPPRSLRNMKKLSLTLSSAQSSTNSLTIPSEPQSAVSSLQPDPPRVERMRRPSIISLPSSANPSAASALLHRKEEDGSPAVPYADGPIHILPGVWLGSEDNARDWKGLVERGIKSILNVAKEVASPFDAAPASQPVLRSTVSTPNLQKTQGADKTFYPPHVASGRPGMHYLKLQWSHGQQDLVENGFQEAMAFTDAAIERGEGVLIHCQCGISRSATMIIALVMRAAAERTPSVPSEIWALKGMQGAYTFVKEKSKWVGPNMSLIYQLLDYEKKLQGDTGSPTPSERSSAIADEEEEWGRRRRLLDEASSDNEDEDRQSTFVQEEAKALDKAMEDRIVARKSSASSVKSTASSVASSSGSGVGMGAAWRSRYAAHGRKRTGSIASNMTNGSILSEDLVEEEEEQDLLNIGGGFDSDRADSAEPESSSNSPDDDSAGYAVRRNVSLTPATPRQAPLLRPPPSAPIWKTSFNVSLQPPATAIRSTFAIPPLPSAKGKKRPAPLGFLPPVPSSPVHIIIEPTDASGESRSASSASSISSSSSSVRSTASLSKDQLQSTDVTPMKPPRLRTESRKPAPPPLHLRSSLLKKVTNTHHSHSHSLQYSKSNSNSTVSTPSQTLFVFPPSPTLTTRTPSTMTLTSSLTGSFDTGANGAVPFPSLSTPRVSTFRGQGGRTRSFIGLGAPPTPTVAFSKVDARGYVGLGS